MKKTLLNLTALLFIILVSFTGCTKDDPEPDPAATIVSPGKQITAFKIVTPQITGLIDTTNKAISITIPLGTDVTNLVTDITLATGHTITPASGAAQDFTNPVVYTVKRPDNTTTTWTVTAILLGINVNQDIAQSVTWTSDKVYFINEEILVDNNAVLTIQPGTVIKFGAYGSLGVGYSGNGTLIANGTSTSPILFTSSAAAPAAGAWEGLFFYDKTLNNTSLTYCNIQFAGKNSTDGALNIIGCNITVNNCNITNSGSYGIYTNYYYDKGGFVGFNNNSISNTAKYGIILDANMLGVMGTGNTFNNVIGISITGDYESTAAQTWKYFNVPYIISDEITIDGNLTIEPGSTFKFEAGGFLSIGYYSSTSFIADGQSANTPITFTSAASSPAAGAWRGIDIYEYTQTNSKMKHCIIEYAGSQSTRGAVSLYNYSSIIFENNIVRNSGSYGIKLDEPAGFESFVNNTVNSCVNHLIVISTEHLPDLGTPNTLTASTGKGIEVSGHVQYSTPVTWKKQTADFYITGGENDIDGVLTIEAGSKILFVNDSFFWFGYYASTKVTAIGTSNDPITFTTASSSPVAGTWKGLYFDESYTQTNSELNYCHFQYSGMGDKPAIYAGASFTVSNTTIENYGSPNAAEYRTGEPLPPGTGNNFVWVAN